MVLARILSSAAGVIGLAAVLLLGATTSLAQTPSAASKGAVAESERADKLLMHTYYHARVAGLFYDDPDWPVSWRPELEGFVQRAAQKAVDVGLKPDDLPFEELNAMVDRCWATTCSLDPQVEKVVAPPPCAARQQSVGRPEAVGAKRSNTSTSTTSSSEAFDVTARFLIATVGIVALVIWRAQMLARRFEATELPGRTSRRGLYFWGALFFLGGIAAWMSFSRLAAG